MLQVSAIANNQEYTVKGLTKRGVSNAQSLIEEVLELDQLRRETQAKLDNTLSTSNNLSRQIGQLMKEGRREVSEIAKKQKAALKNSSKVLSDA